MKKHSYITLDCSRCECEEFLVTRAEVDFEKRTLTFIGECPNCHHMARITNRAIVKLAKGGENQCEKS